MSRFEVQKLTTIKITYVTLTIAFIVSTLFSYYIRTFSYPPNLEQMYSYPGTYMLTYVGWLGWFGWVGLLLTIISIEFLHFVKILRAIIFGLAGSILVGLSLIYIIFLSFSQSNSQNTFGFGFYWGFIVWFGILGINIFLFTQREEKDTIKAASTIKTKVVKEKEEAIGIDWEKIEYARNQSIKLIKAMEAESKELTYIDIMKKTGITNKALERLINEMLSNKEINAKIRDFTIIFRAKKKIPKDKAAKQKAIKKLEKKMSFVDYLIKENKFDIAIKNLNQIKESAKNYELIDYLNKAEEKIDYCRTAALERIEKIKKDKVIEPIKLVDEAIPSITDKSLITEVEEKETPKEMEKVVEIVKPEQIIKRNVFISYSTLDREYFQISKIVEGLKKYPEIGEVLYWEADSRANIVEFMEETLKISNVFVLFCTENSMKSKAVKDEWQAAYQLRKMDMLKMIPVYEDENIIPRLLLHMLNVKFSKENFDEFIENLHKEILRG